MNVEGHVGQAVANVTNHDENWSHVKVVEAERVNPFSSSYEILTLYAWGSLLLHWVVLILDTTLLY
jgi:hypothetical protein